MLSPKSQYQYFQALEKTIKRSLAVYVLILLAGLVLIVAGIDPLISAVRHGEYLRPSVAISALFVVYGLLLYGIGKMTGVSQMHSWLDHRFFNLLERSNQILFEALVVVLDAQEQNNISGLANDRKQSLAHLVFVGLSDHEVLFRQLLRSGIFRRWTWYWVTIYGTVVFTALTFCFFPTILLHLDPSARLAFSVSWSLALFHFGLAIVLGNRLLRMMHDVAELLVNSHREDIASLLRGHLAEYEWS